MNNTPNNTKHSAVSPATIARMLHCFTDKREGLIWIYLLSVADEEWRVAGSVLAMARQLNMHRQTLTRYISRLCEKGFAKWEITAGTRQPNLLHLTAPVTENATIPVTAPVTDDVTAPNDNGKTLTHSFSERYKNEEITLVTTDTSTSVTALMTCKKETEQKKEENPPAPPKEEKKQEKEKNTPTDTHSCEKNPEEKLNQRRQRFLASLLPFYERYGQEMVSHFGDYWTEPNRSLTKMRFELQRTWSTPLRLATWARNDKTFNQQNHIHHDKTNRPTAAELIDNAQRTAIEETERFIREAEIRRGGLPPHLPF